MRAICLLGLVLVVPIARAEDPLREAVIRESESEYAFFLKEAPDYRIVGESPGLFKHWVVYRCSILGGSHGLIEFLFAARGDKAVVLTGNLAGLNKIVSDENLAIDLDKDDVVRLLTLVRPTDHRFWVIGIDALQSERIAHDAIAAAGYDLSHLIETSGRFIAPGVRRFFVFERTSLQAQDVFLSADGLGIRETVLVENAVKGLASDL